MNFKVTVTGKRYHINFKFDCSGIHMIYLLICKRFRKEYIGSTVTKFRLRFNQYKSNIKFCGEGRRGFKLEKLTEHIFCPNHSGTHKDISVQERRKDFWTCHLDTMFPNGLNQKKLLRYH